MTKLAVDVNGAPIQVAALSGSTTVSYTATAAQSSAAPEGVTVVRVISTTACFVAFGADPTATTSDHYLLGATENYFRIEPLSKMSFIRASEDGTAYISYVV